MTCKTLILGHDSSHRDSATMALCPSSGPTIGNHLKRPLQPGLRTPFDQTVSLACSARISHVCSAIQQGRRVPKSLPRKSTALAPIMLGAAQRLPKPDEAALSSLSASVENGDASKVETLLKSKSEPEISSLISAIESSGTSLLQHACLKGQAGCLSMFLEKASRVTYLSTGYVCATRRSSVR